MSPTTLELGPDDWQRLRDALRYQARDLHHRSYAVPADRRELLWEEMDRCLGLAARIEDIFVNERSRAPEACQNDWLDDPTDRTN